MRKMINPSAGDVMVVVSPPVGKVLEALAEMPRAPAWLAKHLEASPDRMSRLDKEAGLVEGEVGWFGRLKLWRLTEKGEAYFRVWQAEMARRQSITARGPSWLPGEEPQPGDTVLSLPTGVPGMVNGVRVVPHNPWVVDVVQERPEDMVSALGLLTEDEGQSINYLVGANPVETSSDRMAAIMNLLEGEGCAVRMGHGWARTPFGTRMHQTWSGAPGSQASPGQY